eukprot:scaffold15150_cov32-Tisochrysis_lutea.AAC.7
MPPRLGALEDKSRAVRGASSKIDYRVGRAVECRHYKVEGAVALAGAILLDTRARSATPPRICVAICQLVQEAIGPTHKNAANRGRREPVG